MYDLHRPFDELFSVYEGSWVILYSGKCMVCEGVIQMNKYLKIVLFGFLLWLIPFIAAFPFVDQSGSFLIPETFFKSIMIVVGGLVGVTLAIMYFKEIGTDYVKEGVIIGVVWLVINLGIDLVFVSMGFFPMTVSQYFTDIGLRYLSIPIYTIGMGYALMQKR